MQNSKYEPEEPMNLIRYLVLFALACLLFSTCSCRSSHQTTEETTVFKYITKDSLVYVDSLIEVPVPVERVVEVCPAVDTLHLETSIAKAWAWLNPMTNLMVGGIENKHSGLTAPVKLPVRTVTVMRSVDHTVTNTVYVKKKIPAFFYFLAGFGAVALVFGIIILAVFIKRKVTHNS